MAAYRLMTKCPLALRGTWLKGPKGLVVMLAPPSFKVKQHYPLHRSYPTRAAVEASETNGHADVLDRGDDVDVDVSDVNAGGEEQQRVQQLTVLVSAQPQRA